MCSIFQKIKGLGVFCELLEMLLVVDISCYKKQDNAYYPTLESRELIAQAIVQREY